jgi:hypothetical protein
MRVAGLAPVSIAGVENMDVTESVKGHMAYRAAMPKLLRECGWAVESDEFTEIEDPDPDNHEKRQRELINEIEEARKELQKKESGKKRFGFFSRKKAPSRKEWETYDESTKAHTNGTEGEGSDGHGNVIFDIDAIQAEVASIAAQGFEVKQLESTLPPLKLDLSNHPQPEPMSTLRETKSYNDSIGVNGKTTNAGAEALTGHRAKAHDYEEYDEFDHSGNGEITMSFDPPPAYESARTFEKASDIRPAKSPSPKPAESSREITAERPALTYSHTTPAAIPINPEHNAWADEYDDEFGKEKEMTLTFE